MKKIFKEVLPYVVIVILVVLIRSFIITPVTVVGDSMLPTLHDNELLLLSKISYRLHDIERFDVVVIKDNDEWIIKRVIGLPGENVSYLNNILYINGVSVKDEYSNGITRDFDLKDICLVGLENNVELDCSMDKIPDEYYLVLGDNRGISKDSRSVGFIKEDKIQGKAVFRFWPINKIKIVK